MPIPRSTRPPDKLVEHGRRLQPNRGGWLKGIKQISVPNRTRLVMLAIAAATGTQLRQIAAVNKVMLGEPDQIRANVVEPCHLLEYLCVKMLIADTRVWWIPKVGRKRLLAMLALPCCDLLPCID